MSAYNVYQEYFVAPREGRVSRNVTDFVRALESASVAPREGRVSRNKQITRDEAADY